MHAVVVQSRPNLCGSSTSTASTVNVEDALKELCRSWSRPARKFGQLVAPSLVLGLRDPIAFGRGFGPGWSPRLDETGRDGGGLQGCPVEPPEGVAGRLAPQSREDDIRRFLADATLGSCLVEAPRPGRRTCHRLRRRGRGSPSPAHHRGAAAFDAYVEAGGTAGRPKILAGYRR